MASRRPPSVNLRLPNAQTRIVWEDIPVDQQGQASGTPIKYRVEDRRRTVIITSQKPPDQWDEKTREEIAKLVKIPDDMPSRRTRSCSPEMDPILQDDSEDDHTPSPRSAHPSSHPYQHTKQHSLSAVALSPVKPAFGGTRMSGRIQGRGAGRRSLPVRGDKIYFYNREDPHYGFTNFSPHGVEYKGKLYPTSEHLFQSFKFQEHRPLLAEHIRTFSDRPSVALSEARRFQPETRTDWMQVNIAKMDETLLLKFSQHPDLKQELLDTGDAELVEDSDKDWFWGVGSDRTGRNELGKALVRLREKFRREG